MSRSIEIQTIDSSHAGQANCIVKPPPGILPFEMPRLDPEKL